MSWLKEYYLQPEAPDPVLSEAEVLRCVRRFVAQAQSVAGMDESGGEARTYVVDDTLILKVQRPQQLRLRTSLAREVFFLRQLAAFDPALPVPRVLGYARETNLLEYNIQTRMTGRAVASASLTPQARREVICAVGRVLRRIHSLPQEPLHASAHFPTDRTVADFKARLARYLDGLAKRLHRDGRAWPMDIHLESIAERVLAALPETDEFVALHSNPGPSHAFVDPDTGRFTGLIDFGDAFISHPALDVWRWHWPADRAAALAGYTADTPVGDDFRQVWQAVSIVADVALIASDPERQAEAVDDLKGLLHAIP